MKSKALFILTACLAVSLPASASEGLGSPLGGLDQSFSAGASSRAFVENFEETVAGQAVSAPSEEMPKPDEIRFYKDFSFTGVYDSNIRLDARDPLDDFYFIYTPTVGLARGRKDVSKVYVETFFDLSYLDYLENEKLSRINQSWTTIGRYKTEKLKISVQNVFQPHSVRSTGDRTELRSRGAAQVAGDFNAFRLNAAYDVTPKVSLSAAYRFDFFHFTSGQNANNQGAKLFSHRDHGIAPRVTYRFSPKSAIYGDYSYLLSDYFEGGRFSSDIHTLIAGFLHKWTPKTDVNLEAGWRFREYRRDDVQDGDGLVWRAAMTRRFTEKISGTIYATQELGENLDVTGGTVQTQDVAQPQNYFGVRFNWKATQRTEWAADAAAGFTHRDGVIRVADLDDPSVSYSRQRDEEIYSWGLSWKWNPTASTAYLLSYRFINKNSSFKNFEYDDQLLVGSVRLRF